MKDNTSLGHDEIEYRFGFHKPIDNDTSVKHVTLRRLFMEFANQLDEIIPSSRAKYVSMTELENASMWAHKALTEQAPVVHEQAG